MQELEYFVGAWSVKAEDPGTGRRFSMQYSVVPILDGAWLVGSGESPEMGLKVQDLWGRDGVTGDIVRVVFDSQGTHGTVHSRGWKDETLVFEGEARTRSGAVRVRETITRIGPAEFKAVWEAQGEQGWTPYSVEHLTRDST
jgi:hypothetical protein